LKIPHASCPQKIDIEMDIQDGIIPQQYDNYFDVAFCLEVSEYLIDPITALDTIYRFLKQNGLLYISFHFLYPVHVPDEFDYLRYTRNGVIKLLERVGFGIEDIVSRKPFSNTDMVQFYFNGLGTRPSKVYKYHDEIGVLVKARKI
jgi:SAM-dependent methyltransferase